MTGEHATGLLDPKLMNIGENRNTHMLLEQPGQMALGAVCHFGEILQFHVFFIMIMNIFQHQINRLVGCEFPTDCTKDSCFKLLKIHRFGQDITDTQAQGLLCIFKRSKCSQHNDLRPHFPGHFLDHLKSIFLRHMNI